MSKLKNYAVVGLAFILIGCNTDNENEPASVSEAESPVYDIELVNHLEMRAISSFQLNILSVTFQTLTMNPKLPI